MFASCFQLLVNRGTDGEEQRMEAERVRLEEQAKDEAERLRLEQEAQAKRQQEEEAKQHQHHARVATPHHKDEPPSEQPTLSFCDFMRKNPGSRDQ